MQSMNVPPVGTDYWQDEDPDYPVQDWQYEVANGDTRAGYWEWAQAAHQLDSDTEGESESESIDITHPVIFVFGSNLQGRHRRGAAVTAVNEYRAVLGKGNGRTGDAYALPTKKTPYETLDLQTIAGHVKTFIAYANSFSENEFIVTRVGCGLAGYTDEQIAPMFKGSPVNCKFDERWRSHLGPSYGYFRR